MADGSGEGLSISPPGVRDTAGETGTRLDLDDQPGAKSDARIWLLQADPTLDDIVARLKREGAGFEEGWGIKSNAEQMRAGDIALVWMSGKDAGIYAIAEVTEAPYSSREVSTGTARSTTESKPWEKTKWRVTVRYTHILDEPIRRERLKAHPVLRNMEIIAKIARSKIDVPVTSDEWDALGPLLSEVASHEEFDRVVGQQTGVDIGATLQRALTAAGLTYSPWQAATFFTALQTKGFVILSGISGTGKSNIATRFAELLSVPAAGASPDRAGDKLMRIVVRPDMKKNRRIVIPTRHHGVLAPMEPGEGYRLRVSVDGKQGTGRLWFRTIDGRNQYLLTFHQSVAAEIGKWSVGQHIYLVPVLSPDGDKVLEIRITNDPPVEDSDEFQPVASSTESQNHLFLSVRPDWRDSKSLLGYFNPLTERYEWTPFLRFLLRAIEDYETGDERAWFVILDEMNLAHVEYYFADLLSVLESGRDEAGWTREPLRLVFPAGIEDGPPPEIVLPPNLYVVGTVNVDETTHAFSPKVLDRAFSLELSTASFEGYPPMPSAAPPLSADESASLLRVFTDDGRFPRIDKEVIRRYVATHPEIRQQLQRLNERLERYNLHFGYRVFDEIVCFLDHAARNGTFDAIGGEDAAFDAAVLMKVLPKFHGSRGRLEVPLRDILAWCVDPDAPADPSGEAVTSRLPRTFDRVRRMLSDLERDGFTAFG